MLSIIYYFYSNKRKDITTNESMQLRDKYCRTLIISHKFYSVKVSIATSYEACSKSHCHTFQKSTGNIGALILAARAAQVYTTVRVKFRKNQLSIMCSTAR